MEIYNYGRRLCSLVLLFIALIQSSTTSADSQDWLISRQAPNGAVLSSSILSDPVQSTHESVVALQLGGGSLDASQALGYLNQLDNLNSESLARVILTKSALGASSSEQITLLLKNQNSDGGFGAYPFYESDVLSTALALRALNSSSHKVQIGKSIAYLLSKQQNGGWKLNQVSGVALTAEVVLSLSNHKSYQGVSAAISSGLGFIQTQKKQDGLWGQTFESALAISALSVGANSAAELSSNVQSLMTRQSNDNWHNDVYTTALSIQAITRVNSIGAPVLTKGGVKGQVILSGTAQPLVGVSVVLENGSLKTTTDNQGNFSFSNIPAGAHTLILSKSGFVTTSGAAIVRSASISDLGQLILGQESTVGLVSGKLFSSQNLQSISNARISISGAAQATTLSSTSGQFEINNLPVGAYSFSIEAAGFRSIAGNFSIQLGRNVQINQGMVSEDAPLISGPGTLNGKVIDSSTGLPLIAQVLIDGVAISTNSAGEFTSAPVLRGSHEIEINSAGYRSAIYDINFPDGASGNIGTLGLYKETQQSAPSTLSLLSQVVDAVSGKPISGASVSTANGNVVTNSSGQALITGLESLEFDVQISAAGYVAQQVSLTASAYGSVAARFELQPQVEEANSWSVGGVLRDETTLEPIANASIGIGGVTTSTDTNGRYLLNNLSDAQLTITLSAEGYVDSAFSAQLGQTKGAYTLDLTMVPESTVASNLRVLSVDAPAAVEPDSHVMLTLDVSNTGNELESALVFVKVVNQLGEEVDSLLPYLPNTDVESPHIDFIANNNTVLQVPWNVKQTAAGSYTLRAEIVQVGSMTRDLPRGKIIASALGDTSVNGVSVLSGALNIDPPILQSGSVVPIKLTGAVRNTGNQLLDAGTLELTISNKTTGEIFHTATSTMDQLEQNEVTEVDFGIWSPAPTQIGELVVKVVRVDGAKGEIINSLYIGDVAKAHYTIDKSVLPEGDSNVKGKIQLSGVDTAINSSVDPLFEIVKSSVEKGAAFTGPAAVSWDKTNKCLGCHIQAQSVAGLGSSLNKANIDPAPAIFQVNALMTGMKSSGSLETDNPSHTKTSTLFGGWALTEWPNQQQTFRTQIKALEQLWRTRSTGSGTIFWTQDLSTGWLDNRVTATALSALIGARAISTETDLGSPPVDYSWGKEFMLATGTGGLPVLKSLGNNIYVAYNNGRVEKVDTETSQVQVLFPSLTGLSGRANGFDIDVDGNFWIANAQGRLIQVTPSGQILKNIAVCSGETGGAVIDSASESIYFICHVEYKLKKFTIATGLVETLATGGLLNAPYGLAFNKDGSLLIANYSSANILKYQIDSKQLSIFSDGLKGLPVHLSVDDHGNVFVAVSERNTTIGVNKIDSQGVAERVLWGNGAWGVTNHLGKIYIGNRFYKTIHAVNELPLNTDVLQSFKNAMPQIARFLLDNSALTQQWNNQQASSLIGLAEVRKHLPEGALRNQVDAKINSIADVLKQRQAPSGGWGLNGVATDATRDPLMTALVGLAMEYTSPSSQDPMVRNAITYLLNSQKANGSWHASVYFTTDLGTTSLIMVYMPKALDRLGGLDVKLSMSQPESVVLSNPSIAPTSTQVDAAGTVNYAWDLKGVTGKGLDISFDLAVKNLQLHETRAVSTNTNLSFTNSFTDELITTQIDIPTVKTFVAQQLDLQTNKLSYQANENVDINNVVTDLGTGFVGGKIELAIRPAGSAEPVAQLNPLAVGVIAQGQNQMVSTQWNTANYLAGQYEIVGQLLDSQNRVIAEDIQLIHIVSTAQGDSALVAKVFTDKPVYKQTEVVKIEANASSQLQNDFASPSLGKLIVTDAQGATVLIQDFAIQQLVKGDRFNRLVPLSTSALSAGNYQVVWSVYDANGIVLLSSSSANFIVESDPLISLVGDVTVQQDSIEKGALQTCDFSVTNQQDSLSNLQINRHLVAIESNSVVQTDSDTVSLGEVATQTYQSILATNSLALGVYACVLEAEINGKTNVLDTALFEIKDAPIKLSGDLVLGGKPGLLVLMDESLSEKAYLDQLLTHNGWYYTIVTTANDFKTEMQTGGYGAYALLSEKVTLTPETRDQLKLKVAKGDGLMVASGHDRRHQSLEEALGVRVHAKQTKIKGIRAESVPLGTWSHNFNQSINSMTFDLKGATLAGRYLFSTSPSDQPKALGTASEFNVFAFENYTSLSSSIEGRMAVGGNLSLQHFGVGDKLNANLLNDVVMVGGNVSFPSGKIYYGNLIAAGSVAGVGDPVRYGMAPGAVIRGNSSTGIDFAVEREWLQELSTSLSAIPANGKVKMKWGGLELTGDCSSAQQVFTVNAADLAVAHTFAVSCIPSGATVIFNIPGDKVSIQNIGMQSLTNIRDKVIFNLPQATTLTLKSVGLEGSLLAPFAKVDQPAGRIEGQVVVKSWYSTDWGYMSIHNRRFGGDLTAYTKPKSDYALAFYQYQKGKTVFAGFDLLEQAALLSGNTNPFEQTLLAALNTIAPVELRVGNFVSVQLVANNTGSKTTPVTAVLTLPSNLQVAPHPDFTRLPNTQNWTTTFTLESGAMITRQIYVRLTDTNPALLMLKLQTGTGDESVIRFEKSLTLSGQ